jgi:hypothetical protein
MTRKYRCGISFIIDVEWDETNRQAWDPELLPFDTCKLAIDYAMRRFPKAVPVFGPNLESVKIELLAGRLHDVTLVTDDTGDLMQDDDLVN